MATDDDHATGTPKSREAQRRRIAEDVSWFIAAGGKIERVPFGVSGQDLTSISGRRALRHTMARKGGWFDGGGTVSRRRRD